MAARDIMPFSSFSGGTITVRYGPMTASEVFEIGEPVMVVNAGTITEPVGSTTSWPVTEFDSGGASLEGGIACWGPGSGNINPKTGIAFTTNDEIAFWPINEGNLFITQNLFDSGDTTTLATPIQTDVGEGYQINQAALNTAWGIEKAAGATGVDIVANVVDVLDAQRAPIRLSGNTGVWVVFFITGTMAGV